MNNLNTHIVNPRHRDTATPRHRDTATPKFKFSRYVTQIIILLFAMFFNILPTLNAQNPLWIMGDQVVDFTNGDNPMLTPTPLPQPLHDIPSAEDEWYYNGQVAQLHQNAQYDADGNLLFFIIDGWIYNKDGYMIADPWWLYEPGSFEDNEYVEIGVQANAADIIISPVPNQCNLYYLIFSEVHPQNSPGLNANYMILDTEGPNQFFPDNPDITGRVLNSTSLTEFPNFDQTIFDTQFWDDRGILFQGSGSVGTQPIALMELHDFKGNDNKHLYISYQNKVWRFIVREDKIHLQSIYSYFCDGIVTEFEDGDGNAPAGNYTKDAVWKEITVPGSPDDPMDIARLNGGDMQIHYVDHFDRNAMVFVQKAETGLGIASLLYFTILNEDGSIYEYLGCILYVGGEIYGFNFSENGNYLYINYELSSGLDGGLHCWELLEDHAELLTLPINQNSYFENGFSKSRIENNFYNNESVLYTLGNSGIGIIKNLRNPANLEFEEIGFSLDIDFTGYISWWVAIDDPYKFRFLTKQNYKIGPVTDISLEPECCLPDLNEVGYGDMSFTADETWTYGNNPFGNTTEPVKVKGTFTFENGSKIDFKNMEFQFGPDAKIVIEPGARLILDGATLTSACNVLWRGLFVVGNTNETQSYSKQGYLITKNNAVISNATFAVRNYGLTASGSIDPDKSGGIIRATSTAFINNKTDVRMRTFKKYYSNGSPKNDLSYFKKCEFITDKNVFEEMGIVHINLYDVNKVIISGCSFSDSRFHLRSFEKSIGIYAINAAFKVGDYGSTYTSFNYLHYAIKAWDYFEATITIENAEFNSFKGVYFNGIDHSKVTGNTFNVEMFNDQTGQDNTLPYGFYLDQCTDYTVQKNYFIGIDNSYIEGNFGLVVHNTHGLNTTIRNNEFFNLSVGAEAIGQNKGDIFEVDGLQLLCNNAINNEFDFAVLYGGDIVNGIALNQGQAGDLTTDPAGNIFTSNTNFKNYWNNVDHFNYFHHKPTPEFNVVPSTQGSISLFGSTAPMTAESCPTDNNDEDDEISVALSKMSDASGTIAQINVELNNLVDGGNTEAMENDVILTDNADAWNKYLQLMAEAGYLSEDVLAEVSKKETGFSEAMIRNILAANPQAAKSAEVQKNLDERINPLPDYMREQIDLGLTKISPKEYLEWVRAAEKRTYDRLLNQVLQTWLADTLVDRSTDIIDLLSNTGDINNDYRLVDYYDNKGETMLADMLLDVINGYPMTNNQQEDYNHFSDFRNLTLQWEQSGVDMVNLTDAQIFSLQDYAAMRYPVGARAMALLELNGALDYNEPLFVPDGGDKSFGGGKKRSVAKYDNMLALFPNPSNSYFTVDYSLKDVFNTGKLMVMDVNGKIVYQAELYYTRDQILIAVEGWTAGQYTCVLLADGKTMLSKKITIIK